MAPRDRVGGRAGKAVVALCAGRERDVLDERQQLDRREAEAEQHRPERQREPCDPSRRVILTLFQGQVQGEQPRGDQQVVGDLEVAEQTMATAIARSAYPSPRLSRGAMTS